MSFSISTSLESQSFLGSFLNSSNDGVMVMDLKDRKLVLVNPAMEKMLGSAAHEIATLGPYRFMPEFQPDGSNSKQNFDKFWTSVSKGEKLEFECQMRKINGVLFFASIKAFQIRGDIQDYWIAIHKEIPTNINNQEPLNLQKEEFEYLFENVFDGILIYDSLLDKHIQCNQKLLDYLGIESSSTLLSNYWKYSSDIQLNNIPISEAKQNLIRRINQERNIRYKWRLRRANNQIVIADITTMKLSSPNERYTLSLFKDITEEEKAVVELEKNKQDLLNSQTMARMASFSYDVVNDQLEWSEYAYQVIGIPKNKAPLNISFFIKQIHVEDQDYFKELLTFARQNICSIETEFRLFDWDNEIIFARFKAEPTLVNGRQIFSGTVQDISDQKMGLQALTETNARYIDLFDNMYDALLIVDEKGNFKDGNLAAERLLGYSRVELKNIKIADIVHPDDRAKSLQSLEKLVQDGYYSDYTGRIIRKDGSIRYLQVNSTAIYKDGIFSGSRDIARDITQIKEAEDKREKLLVKLEKVNQELNDFAYIVSHDLKAPLRAISSLSTWLIEDYSKLLDQPGIQKLQLLNNRVNRMHGFIDAILEYSKIAKSEVYKEAIDLNALINNTIEILIPPANFLFEFKGNMPIFFGDRTRLEQLFQNLIGNAIKYNDKPSPKVTISCEANDYELVFCFQDNGPGIPTKDFEKVFQIFKTLQSRDEMESTGIGLTIVKRIVELYGGKIEIESELGKGTCFKFNLLINKEIKL